MMNGLRRFLRPVLVVAVTAFSWSFAHGQRIAIFTPAPSDQSNAIVERLAESLESKFRVIDSSIARAAFNSVKVDNALNLTADRARSIGAVIGCDHFVLVKAVTTRRTSSAKPKYFEAYAVVYLVNSRTGFLEYWHLESKQGKTPAEAEKLLLQEAASIARAIESKVSQATNETEQDVQFEMFDPDSKTMRPTMPYRRIKPEYTPTAFLYEVAATVEAEASIDEKGVVRRIDIVRWAGFGLDEAVIGAIRQMNWRPGERGGRPLPMRVLLRYNFTKVEKE
jgi:hypothetical protein